MNNQTREDLLRKRAELVKVREGAEKGIANIDGVLALYEGTVDAVLTAPEAPVREPGAQSEVPPAYGMVGALVAKAIAEQSHTFTVPALEQYFKERGEVVSLNSIQSAIRRFTQQGKVRLVRRGAGRKASIFRRVENDRAT